MFRQRLDDLRNKWQHLSYQRKDYEKKARQSKRDGAVEEEKAAWAIAQRFSEEEHKAESEYNSFKRVMRENGVKP